MKNRFFIFNNSGLKKGLRIFERAGTVKLIQNPSARIMRAESGAIVYSARFETRIWLIQNRLVETEEEVI